MTNATDASVGSSVVDPDFGLDDEGPFFPWLPPEDRLWRHPSEVPPAAAGAGDTQLPSTAARLLAGSSAGGRTWTVALIAGVIGAMAASGIGVLAGAFDKPTTVIHSVNQTGSAVSVAYTGAPTSWTSVYNAVAPSIVAINAGGAAIGSGVLLVSAGREAFVVTARSLIMSAREMGGLSALDVTFQSGTVTRGKLVGDDPLSGLAVISVPNLGGSLAAIGSVSQLDVANPVLAVGARNAPGGSVISGFVSAVSREVDTANGADMQNMIAISSTPLPTPMAGGPLVDVAGQVVGINVDLDPTDTNDQEVDFAIPVDVAEHIAQQLLAGETVTHPWLGLPDPTDVGSSFSRAHGLAGGVLAGQVAPGSPASRVGLQPGDVITGLNDRPVTSTGVLTALLDQCDPGHLARISYLHDGAPATTMVTILEQPYNS